MPHQQASAPRFTPDFARHPDTHPVSTPGSPLATRLSSRLLMAMVAMLALCLFGPAPSQAQPLEWREKHLSARTSHQMAYDSVRGVTVLFGGSNYSTNLNDTVEWNGAVWTQRVVSGAASPPVTSGHAMVFDAARGVTVLFGGNAAGTLSGETWEWNGSMWTQRMVSGPSPRQHHAMVYDSARRVTVLFGGSTTGFVANGETWEWDGITWNQRLIVAPSPRSTHKMTFDSVRGITVLFGGTNAGGDRIGETWEWNGSTWTQRLVSSPTPRTGHSMAYDEARGVTVLFGGYAGSAIFSDETWEWDGVAWNQRLVVGPLHRQGAAMVFDAARRVILLFGGLTGTPDQHINGETWEWNGSGQGAWTLRSAGPSQRQWHAMAYDSARGVTVLFGGCFDFTGAQSNGETWEWNGVVWNRRMVSGPSPRNGHAMVYDAARGVTVLFGGRFRGTFGFPEFYADTWEWNGTVWTQRMVSGPPPQAFHAMAYDTTRGVTVLFGTSSNNQTWEWNGTVWTQRVANGPSQRSSHAMAYDAVRGVVVLFGGQDTSVSRETWEWNGAGAGTWTLRSVSGPAPRIGHAMTFDSDRGAVILFGGLVSPDIGSDTWEWNGTAWTQLSPTGPSYRLRRYAHAMTYDSARKVSVVFGGNSNTSLDDTWELGTSCTEPSIATQPNDQTVCPAGTATIAVVAAGTEPFTYQWQVDIGMPGSPEWCDLTDLQPGGGCLGNGGGGPSHALFSGVMDATLSISSLSVADARAYRCVVTNACGSIASDSATLTICPADFNCDAFVNSQDFFDFLAAFFSLQPAADFNHDTFINSQDFFDFIAAFFTGC